LSGELGVTDGASDRSMVGLPQAATMPTTASTMTANQPRRTIILLVQTDHRPFDRTGSTGPATWQ